MTTIELFKPAPRAWSRSIDFPTEWNELSEQELRMISHTLAINGSRQELLIRLIDARAKAQGKKMPYGWEVLLSSEDATINGLPLIDGLLKANNLTRNPWPMLGSYYGPDDAFDNLTVGEFEDGEVFANLYIDTRKEEYLLELASILWRPAAKKKGKLVTRVQYAEYEPDAQSFSKRVDLVSLQVIWLWYSGCRALLVQLFPEVFGGGGTGKDADPTAFTRVVHNAAGVKNGTRPQVRATLVKELLFECKLAAELAIEMERNTPK